jgi:predicted SprT family Zn-dependent metalloprotease
MSIKFERKTVKEDEIWFFKKIIPNKIIAIKRMSTKFERLKNHRGWNWKTFVVCINKIKMQKDNKKRIKIRKNNKPGQILKTQNPWNPGSSFNQEIYYESI